MYNKRFIRACLPALFILAAQLAYAASGDGSLVGHIKTEDKSAASGVEVTARNPATGFSRSVKAEADGSYRFPYLPVGNYTVEASKDGKSLGSLPDVTVNLGVATNVDMDLGDTSLEVVTARLASGERGGRHVHRRATNLTRFDVEQLPSRRT
jgi:hypothetical protein